jgi:hypothetical protein
VSFSYDSRPTILVWLHDSSPATCENRLVI